MGRLTFEKAVILGATGPTGIHLAQALQGHGLALRVVSRSQDKLERAFGSTPAEQVVADLSSAEATARAVDGCDLVFDCIGLPGERMHEHAITARNIAIYATGEGHIEAPSVPSNRRAARIEWDVVGRHGSNQGNTFPEPKILNVLKNNK